VCTSCGAIIGQVFESNEPRAYTAEEISKRRQTEPSWRDFGPRTNLSSVKADSKGKIIDSKKRVQFSRLSKIQNSLINSIERNYWEAKPKLKKCASKLNLPDYIFETAWRIYTEVAKRKLTMGRSIEGFVASSLYAAIRIHEFPRVLDEVAEAAMVPKRSLFKFLGLIVKDILPDLQLRYRPLSTEKLIFVFGSKLGLPMEAQMQALNLYKEILESGLCNGKDPKGFAAAALYLIVKDSEINKTQTEVAKAAKVTEVTIRSRVKDIKLIVDYV
jgi:transcription initiation factor TFIIB